jgi:hypothetical protein
MKVRFIMKFIKKPLSVHSFNEYLEWRYLLQAQRTENLKFKTESVLKKYFIVPAYLNFRNDLNVVLNFSVDIIRFRRPKWGDLGRTFPFNDCDKDWHYS